MTSKEIGSIIKEARLSKKMTQNEVVGDFITRNMLSLIENGTATPSIRTLQYLTTKLEIPMSQFSVDEESIANTHDEIDIWLQSKCHYSNHEYDICLHHIAPFLVPEHFLYDEACALTALCYLHLANHYAESKDLIAATSAAKQANHYAGLGIFRNQQIAAESVLLLNQLANQYQ